MQQIRSRIQDKLLAQPDEFEVITRFLQYLHRSQNGQSYLVADVDVTSDDGRHNFDFLLVSTDGTERLAVELTVLVEEEAFRHRQNAKALVKQLQLKMISAGVPGFYILQVPINVELPHDDIDSLTNRVRNAVLRLAPTLKGCQPILVDGVGFTLCRDTVNTELQEVQVFPYMTSYSPSPEFNQRLKTALEGKNIQLAVDGVSRRILVITDEFLVKGGCGFATLLLAKMDFTEFQNIDEIFYESGKPGEFCSVYER
jgi:hypothetical protein